MNTPASARSASPLQAYPERLHAQFATLDVGQVAQYIPELAKVDPAGFGIVIATVNGLVYGSSPAATPSDRSASSPTSSSARCWSTAATSR